MSELRVNFSVFKSEILYNQPQTQASVGDEKHEYLHHKLHVNPNEKNIDNPKTYFRGFRISSKGVPAIEVIQNSNDVSHSYALRRTVNAFKKEPLICYIRNTPLFFIKFPKGKIAENYMCISFLEKVTSEEDYVLLDFGQKSLSVHDSSDQPSELRWNINSLDTTMVPRIPWLVWYTTYGDCFIVEGGLVPTKFLPAEYFDFCVNTYLEVRPFFSREYARRMVEQSFYITDDLWIFFPKENRWEMILPPTPLSYLKTAGGRHRSALRNQMFNKGAVIEADKKVYFFSIPSPESAKLELVELFALDLTCNKYERVEEFDKISYKFKNYRKFYVGYDKSHDTMVFVSDKLDSVIVMCLQTFNCIEFAIKASFPPEYLDYCWHPIIYDGQGKLAIESYSNEEKPLGPDKDGVEITDTIGLIDWESIQLQKVDPFLQNCRKKSVFQTAKTLWSDFFKL